MKRHYLDSLAQYRLATSVKDEIETFLKGLNDIIPDNLLCIFDENELEVSCSVPARLNEASVRLIRFFANRIVYSYCFAGPANTVWRIFAPTTSSTIR